MSPRNRGTSSSVRKAGALVSPSSCLDGEPHGWVPVDTHSTPVLTSVRRLWVACEVYEPNEPQEHAQLAHLGDTTQNHDRTEKPAVCRDKNHVQEQSRGMFNVLNNVDLFPSNVQFSRQEALLYVFEGNEAVIKVIIEGRSPTMRHVSRTHRVALDWLFDRVNLDPKIQIKYIDTKNQLADILTKGNFTRHEWNHLLCLSNISHFSSTVCSAAMAKRSQQDSGEEQVTAKSRPVMNLIARSPSFVKIHRNQLLEKVEQGNLVKKQIYSKPLIITTMSNSWRASLPQIIQDWIMTVLGLLKSGKLRLRRTIDQGDLIKLLGEWYDKFDLITKKCFSRELRNPSGTEKHFVIDQDD